MTYKVKWPYHMFDTLQVHWSPYWTLYLFELHSV